MKKLFKYTLPVFAIIALAACSDDDSVNSSVDPSNGREMIAFSPEGLATTRSGAIDPNFIANTKVIARIKAEGKTASDIRYTQTVLTAAAHTTKDDDCNTYYKLSGQHSHVSYSATDQTRYWDDAFGRDSKLTVYAVAIPNDKTTLSDDILDRDLTNDNINEVNKSTNRNWYTITSPETEETEIPWFVSSKQDLDTRLVEDIVYSNNIRVRAANDESDKGRYVQTYSGGTWTPGMAAGRLQWEAQASGSTTGKFDQGHLIFKHALSWITIKLKEGAGFDNTSASDFGWTNKPSGCAQSITLTGFYTSGNLDVSKVMTDATLWTGTSSTKITQMDETTGNPDELTTRVLHAYVLPGNNLYTTTTNVIEFEIDEAKYYVTGKQIAEAIQAYYRADDPSTTTVNEAGPGANDPNASEYSTFTTTKPGKNYVINLTVAKKGINNITAAVLDWETVNSTDAAADNAHCSFSFEDRGSKMDNSKQYQFNIYRAAKDAAAYIDDNTAAVYNWETGYTTTIGNDEVPNMATKTYLTNQWSTNWFFENNRTYYHFRAAGKGDNGAENDNDVTINKDATNGDYFNITHGNITGSSYYDYVWGAPFNDVEGTYKFKYDNVGEPNSDPVIPPTGFAKNGTTYQISKAIGATNSQINMLLFHMTCQISVNVKTTTDDSKVVLENANGATDATKYTKVEILRFLPNGKVLMGNGLVTAISTDSRIEAAMQKGTYHAQTGSGTSQDPYVAAYVEHSYGMVPQSLKYGSGETAGTIGLRITTPDGNQYLVKDLSTCTGSITTPENSRNLIIPYTASGSNYIINEWYPHFKYTYTVTIKKTGILNITASVLPWETVNAEITTPITLEN